MESSIDAKDTQMMVVGAGETSGKSPAFFLLSPDQRFILKTMTWSDLKCFLSIAASYLEHVTRHPDTWISKFLGLYTVQVRVCARALVGVCVPAHVWAWGKGGHLPFFISNLCTHPSLSLIGGSSALALECISSILTSVFDAEAAAPLL